VVNKLALLAVLAAALLLSGCLSSLPNIMKKRCANRTCIDAAILNGCEEVYAENNDSYERYTVETHKMGNLCITVGEAYDVKTGKKEFENSCNFTVSGGTIEQQACWDKEYS
jgi:hypothetical protein